MASSCSVRLLACRDWLNSHPSLLQRADDDGTAWNGRAGLQGWTARWQAARRQGRALPAPPAVTPALAGSHLDLPVLHHQQVGALQIAVDDGSGLVAVQVQHALPMATTQSRQSSQSSGDEQQHRGQRRWMTAMGLCACKCSKACLRKGAKRIRGCQRWMLVLQYAWGKPREAVHPGAALVVEGKGRARCPPLAAQSATLCSPRWQRQVAHPRTPLRVGVEGGRRRSELPTLAASSAITMRRGQSSAFAIAALERAAVRRSYSEPRAQYSVEGRDTCGWGWVGWGVVGGWGADVSSAYVAQRRNAGEEHTGDRGRVRRGAWHARQPRRRTCDHRRRLQHHAHEQDDVGVPHVFQQAHFFIESTLHIQVHFDACGSSGGATAERGVGGGMCQPCNARGRQHRGSKGLCGRSSKPACRPRAPAPLPPPAPPLESCCSEPASTPKSLSEDSCLIATSVSCQRPSHTCSNGGAGGSGGWATGRARPLHPTGLKPRLLRPDAPLRPCRTRPLQ